MKDAKIAFAQYYKSERDRAESALIDILDILCKEPAPEGDNRIEAALTRLEFHWRRYGDSIGPGT